MAVGHVKTGAAPRPSLADTAKPANEIADLSATRRRRACVSGKE
jgi:hypothetical protein